MVLTNVVLTKHYRCVSSSQELVIICQIRGGAFLKRTPPFCIVTLLRLIPYTVQIKAHMCMPTTQRKDDKQTLPQAEGGRKARNLADL
jgi:hypothetical protein